jgi:protein-disulfide isomerase
VTLTLPVGDRDHIEGELTAPVVLVEYGDYECPHCGHAFPIIKRIQKAMGDDLCFVFRNFPLTEVHPHAQEAAEAVEAAAAQGRFKEMHDIVFDNQEALAADDLVAYAERVGLDMDRFVSEMETGAHYDRVREDFMSGVRSGVNGTPTFFVNGDRYEDSWEYGPFLANLQRVRDAR